MVKSMTGFARGEGKFTWGTIELEMRSVNHRYLEMNIKVPEELRALEMSLRERIKNTINRGKLDCAVRIVNLSDTADSISYNVDLARQIANTLHQIDKLIYNAASSNAMDILKWPGVLVQSEVDIEMVKSDLYMVLERVLGQLNECKSREGEALKQLILKRCEQMQVELDKVKNIMPELLQEQRKRLEERLSTLKSEMDQDRLEQEMVIVAQKADVDEEIDRIATHLTEIKRIMENDGTIGRRLDFLMQELNREANTLASKSLSSVTTQAAIDMKVLIEQMREQIQNIE